MARWNPGKRVLDHINPELQRRRVEDLEGRRFGAVEYPQLRCRHFDLACRQLRIGHSLGAKTRVSLDRYDVLAAERPCALMPLPTDPRVENDLGDSLPVS